MAKSRPKYWLEGLVPATFTPFDHHGELDLPKLKPYCDYLLSHDIKAIYINGTTGEGKSLTSAERKLVTEEWIKISAGRLSIIVHVGSLNMKESEELARHAARVGADAIATLPPLFFKPDSIDALIRYCKKIAAAAPLLPFYYYHLPIMTNVHLNIEDFLQKASQDIPSLVGVKFSDKNLVDMIGCTYVCNGRFNILYGCDEQIVAGYAMGAHGGVGSLYNYAPELFQRIIGHVSAGELEKARDEQIRAQRFCRIMYRYGAMTGGNVAPQKAVMKMTGLDMGPPREPLRAMTSEEYDAFCQELTSIGFLDWR